MRLRNVKNKEEILNSSSFLIKEPKQYYGTWSSYFGNSNPIHIEIGMGKGKFIREHAKRYPNINFIGIEKYDSVIAKCLPVIDPELKNLAIVRMDALEIDQVFDHEISRIYLNFSDPWPKRRHTKRRLTYHTFLSLYKQVLKTDGEIHFKTDNRGLFAYSLESMSQFGMYFTKINLNLHQEEKENNIETEYERKFSDRGSRIYRMEAKFHSN